MGDFQPIFLISFWKKISDKKKILRQAKISRRVDRRLQADNYRPTPIYHCRHGARDRQYECDGGIRDQTDRPAGHPSSQS